jgi:flavin-dependent dehydrogenase
MTAADVAARVVDPDDPRSLDRYERGWRDELGNEIRLGALVRRAYSLPERVQTFVLDLLSGEIGVHMDRPTSVFSLSQVKAMLRSGR